ncbi:MAG: hypothetical protein K1X89_09435 [Myxococcaceae bacterium]|nr:hypothetical protein [Myxococcaceae bacterium]
MSSTRIPGSSSMPPMPKQPEPGTQTSDRYGNVIATRPAPAPERPPAGPPAPTSDRWGHVIAPPTERAPGVPTSTLHFSVHPGMDEVKGYAEQQGWLAKGFTHLSIVWQDLVFTTDNWKTTRTLRSSDVPSPVVNGRFLMPNVPKGAQVEFAIHVGVSCHAPSDIGGYRERGELWLNNAGQNFRQVSS